MTNNEQMKKMEVMQAYLEIGIQKVSLDFWDNISQA
jgi:hypothetical protein